MTVANAFTAIIAYIIIGKWLADSPRAGNLLPVKWLERISMTSIVYLCTNHLMIKYARAASTRLLGGKSVLQIPLTFVIAMALIYGISELVYRTKLRAIVGSY